MSKNTIEYWNVLASSSAESWQAIEDTDGMLEQLTLAMDEKTGDYTRLTRFKTRLKSFIFIGLVMSSLTTITIVWGVINYTL